ncbi:MAG TPA: ABC transporter substrate-binding protein [Geminicoccaceae bacterium]|nr:ABC transporter substrate-binding protein [Geminicoccaceae bacterium]
MFEPSTTLPSGILAAVLAASLTLTSPASAAPPDEPLVVDFAAAGKTIGKPGGTLDMLVGRPRDTRLMVVYGYARLVGYDQNLELVPDILKDVDVEDGRIFTFHLRKGHKWSDGEPFTSEDFRYWWEDVANNEALFPVGPPADLIVDGELPKVEILDELTVRYSWSKPNPFFLPLLAQATPLFIYMPAHYLKQFHERYADPDELAAMIAKTQARDWAQLHGRKDGMYDFDNPDLPTLQPWMLTNAPPATRFVFVRNPYFHRVDPDGQQLPYIDKVVFDVVDDQLIPVKTGAGETDLQSRGLFFKHYTFLKESEQRSGLQTHLWNTAQGAHLAIYPNLNAQDEVWRELFRDVRFRRALSLGINRDEINQMMFYGLGAGGNNTVLPQSPLYKPEYREHWATYDPEQANALLDEIGLTERSPDGLRLLPDGRPMELVVETAGEDSEQSDVLELVEEDWLALGIQIHTRPSQRELFRNRIFSGETLMSIWYGLENGIPTADMSPQEFAPTNQQQLQWPKWGQYYETKGQAGEAPDTPEAKKLLELFGEWRQARSTEERRKIWDAILPLYSDQVYSIGLISSVMQPVAVRKSLRNVPDEAVYNWEPGAQLGIYHPDTFWFDNS